jgi:hypothetical protein
MTKRDRDRQDRYFQVHHYMLKSDAWRALSAPARAVYIAIGSRYNGVNNGRLSCSVRDAATECNLAINTASRALRELIDLGFIEETRHGSLSKKTRVASEWRLTAFRCDLTGALKTCLFMQRGTQARASRQSRTRSPRLSQTTISAVSNDDHECLKTDNSLYQTTISDSAECLKRRSVEPVFEGPPVSNEGTHIIYHVEVASQAALDGEEIAAPPSLATPVPDAPTPDGSPPANSPTPSGVAPPRLVWTKPVVRELEEEAALASRAAP